MEFGDYVTRKSHNEDLIFEITDIEETDNLKKYILSGVSVRIVADATISDLVKVSDSRSIVDYIYDKKVKEKIESLSRSHLKDNGENLKKK